MEQSKAMEYESRKASSDVLKQRNIYIYIYIYIYILQTENVYLHKLETYGAIHIL